VKIERKIQGEQAQIKSKTQVKKRPEIQAFNKNKLFIWIAVIAIVTFFAYLPVLKSGITNWDDDQYIEKNPWLKELSKDNIKSMFTGYYMGNYHPLAMLSLSLDFKMGGLDDKGAMKPEIYHITNLLIHIFNTLLVFWLILLLFSRIEIAIIGSFLFGLSTLHVESVAWVSERKDVIYAFFFIASLVAYLNYVKHRKTKYYIYSIVLFILSLFSKGQAVSLALSLFAIDYLFERNILEKKVLIEKIPFLILAFLFGIIAIKAQQASNAMHDTDSYEFYKRIGFAGYGFSQYVIKLLVPTGLSAINPYPDIVNKSIPTYYWLFLIPVILSVWGFFYYLKRSRAVSFCIAFFFINIVLLLQLIPVGSAVWADRYSYIPSIGYYTLLAWLIYQLISNFDKYKTVIYGLAGLYLLSVGFASFERCKVWNNSMALWDDTLEKSPNAVVAWNNRGSIKDKNKDHIGAINDFTRAVTIKPDYTHAFYNRGTAKKSLAEQNNDSTMIKSAISDFDFALKMNHAFVEALRNRAQAKELLADFTGNPSVKTALLSEALADLDKTININNRTDGALVSRGVIKGKLNRFDEAIEDFNLAISINPDSTQAWSNRGLAKDFKGDYPGALSDYSKAIELNPNFDKAYYNRALTHKKMKDYQLAINDFNEAIKLSPKVSDAYYYRGLCYVSINSKDLACKDFQSALSLGNVYAKQQMDLYCNK